MANASFQAGDRGDGSIKGSELGFNKAVGQQTVFATRRIKGVTQDDNSYGSCDPGRACVGLTAVQSEHVSDRCVSLSNSHCHALLRRKLHTLVHCQLLTLGCAVVAGLARVRGFASSPECCHWGYTLILSLDRALGPFDPHSACVPYGQRVRPGPLRSIRWLLPSLVTTDVALLAGSWRVPIQPALKRRRMQPTAATAK